MRVLPRTFRSITDLLLARSMVLESTPGAAEKVTPSLPQSQHRSAVWGYNRRGTYWAVEISFVNGINQTNHFTNQERPCTTVKRIEKELSICQS